MTTPKPAGRPTMYGEKLQRVTVLLPAAIVEEARRLGHGNISAGIRAALSPRPADAPGGAHPSDSGAADTPPDA